MKFGVDGGAGAPDGEVSETFSLPAPAGFSALRSPCSSVQGVLTAAL
jgi:hypothetical protein